jgi:hypothetical protein
VNVSPLPGETNDSNFKVQYSLSLVWLGSVEWNDLPVRLLALNESNVCGDHFWIAEPVRRNTFSQKIRAVHDETLKQQLFEGLARAETQTFEEQSEIKDEWRN